MNTSATLPLDFTKKVLEKMSFEPCIFRKELRKALKRTAKQDIQALLLWCKETFRKKKINK